MVKKSKSFWAKVAGAVIGIGLASYMLATGNVQQAIPLFAESFKVLSGITEDAEIVPVPTPTPTPAPTNYVIDLTES